MCFKRKMLACFFIFLLAFTFSFALMFAGDTGDEEIPEDPVWLYASDGTHKGSYGTISGAIDDATSDNYIYVQDWWPYEEEEISIETENLSILGESHWRESSEDHPIIDGGWINDGYTNAGNALEVSDTDNVTIRGLVVTNGGLGEPGGETPDFISPDYIAGGVWLSSTSSSEVSENEINNNEVGVGLDNSGSNSILGNEITDNELYGVMLDSSGKNIISGNVMEGNTWVNVVFSSGSNQNIVAENDIVSGYGVVSMDSWDNWIFNNNIQINETPEDSEDPQTGLYYNPFTEIDPPFPDPIPQVESTGTDDTEFQVNNGTSSVSGENVFFNSITGSDDARGLWSVRYANIDATFNYWGSSAGPDYYLESSGEGIYLGGGVDILDERVYVDDGEYEQSVAFSPWLAKNPDSEDTAGVQLGSPLTFVVAEVGREPSEKTITIPDTLGSNSSSGDETINRAPIGSIIIPPPPGSTLHLPGGYFNRAVWASNGFSRTADTIQVLKGTYSSSVPITDSVLVQGVQEDVVIDGVDNSGNGLVIEADNVTMDNLEIKNFGNGISFDQEVSNINLQDLVVSNNNPRGIEIHNNAEVNVLNLEGVNLNNMKEGIRVSTGGAIDGLTILNGSMDNNDIGLEIYADDLNTSNGNVKNILIDGTSFSNNTDKGIYAETFSNAILRNLEIVDSGTSDTYSWNAGIDLNLKYGSYQDISIVSSTITGVEKGDNGEDSKAPVGITVKARDSGDYSSPSASLDDVNLRKLIVTDNPNGIRIGEMGKNNAGPTDVDVRYSNISNNSNFGLINVAQPTVNASLNYWGHATGPHHPTENPKGKGNKVSDNVIFAPWIRVDPDTHSDKPGVQLPASLSFMVDDAGPKPDDGYLYTALSAASDMPGQNNTIYIRPADGDSDYETITMEEITDTKIHILNGGEGVTFTQNKLSDDVLVIHDGGETADFSLNYWGSPPNVEGKTENLLLSPWLLNTPDTNNMTYMVGHIGADPSGSLDRAIADANKDSYADKVVVDHGTYTASSDQPVEQDLEIISVKGSPANTFINGDTLNINSSDVRVGKREEASYVSRGFTVNADVTVGSGVDASTVHVNWNNLYGQVKNNGDQTLDATWNWWGDTNPSDDTVGDVDYDPWLPEKVGSVLDYMEEHGITNPENAVSGIVAENSSPSEQATAEVTELGLDPEQADSLIDEFGRSQVLNALENADTSGEFVQLLNGFRLPAGAAGGLTNNTVAGGAGSIGGKTVGAVFTKCETIEVNFPLADFQGNPTKNLTPTVSLVELDEDGNKKGLEKVTTATYEEDSAAYVATFSSCELDPGYYQIHIDLVDDSSLTHVIQVKDKEE